MKPIPVNRLVLFEFAINFTQSEFVIIRQLIVNEIKASNNQNFD
jgi:hypothetical protein